jgi:hypothetical protein
MGIKKCSGIAEEEKIKNKDFAIFISTAEREKKEKQSSNS